MANDFVELLEDTLAKVREVVKEKEELEKSNKQLEEELGKAKVENWQMQQEIATLKGEVEKWKAVAFKR